jgi:serine/threonine protein kinase/tetratricopeptide (TPR) repeat protein
MVRMNNAEMDLLDRLLTLTDADRARELQLLAAKDPQLQGRMARLLRGVAVDSQHLMSSVVRVLGGVAQSDVAVHEPGQAIAGYRLLHEIGRGGMSVVWLAERMDGVIKRTVALKLPLYMLTSTADVARFAREKDVLAALTHPNIATLYDAGVSDCGQPFIVLEYVEGVPISTYCDQHQLSIRERVQIFTQVLAAVDDAHRHLIVHLDLKPSNILVDTHGRVKLLDFGIARLLCDPTGHPPAAVAQRPVGERTTGVAMTALYAAPEQVLGLGPSTLTDVYTLGVLLHELLTGASPYQQDDAATSVARLFESISSGAVTPPSRMPLDTCGAAQRSITSVRRLRDTLAGDLDAIVAKAMGLDPIERYSSVERLATDLQCWLTHRSPAARPAGVLRGTCLLLRRHRAASLAAGLGAMLALAAGASAVQQYQEAQANEQRAVKIKVFLIAAMLPAETGDWQLQQEVTAKQSIGAVPDGSLANNEVTAKQLIRGAIDMARTEFVSEPRLQGELLTELGAVYARLSEPDVGKQTIDAALKILEAAVPDHDPVLNRARALLADLLLLENQQDTAESLAIRARDSCADMTIGCARVRVPANSVLSEIYRHKGRTRDSLSAMQQSVADIALGWGALSPILPEQLSELAMVQRNVGLYLDASHSIERARALATKQSLRKTVRLQLLRNSAVIDLELGRYRRARTELLQLLPKLDKPADVLMHSRLLANVYIAEGHPAAALAALEAASHSSADTSNDQQLFALQAQAQAHALLGNFGRALSEQQQVIHRLGENGYKATAPEMLRARRIHGELLLRAGRAAEAAGPLVALLKELQALTEPRILELAQIMELLGCAQRELGATDQSIDLHQRARAELERILPPDHPFFARNTLYRLAALASPQQLRGTAAATSLAPDSVWQMLLAAQLDPQRCGLSKCVLVLW